MQVDQSGSAWGGAHVKREPVADWSSSFVTLNPIGPVSGGCTLPFFQITCKSSMLRRGWDVTPAGELSVKRSHAFRATQATLSIRLND